MKQHVCPWWFAYSFDNPLRRLLHPAGKVLGPWVREGMTVLDVGCGIGHFSLGLARLVGPAGRVIAVDIQRRALAVLMRRARRAGLEGRITPRLCEPAACRVGGAVDFVLAFWMLHETPSAEEFCRGIVAILAESSRFLVVEPAFHVSGREFEDELAAAARAGLRVVERPRVRASRAALLSL